MSEGTRPKPVVVVMGTTAEEPPPGIDAIAGDVELRYAPDRASLEREIADAEIVYTWWGEREDLEAAWPSGSSVKWVAASNVGINRLLFPALVESDVPLTNARGAADGPIAETVVGFVVAMAKGFRPMFDRQRAHAWELHQMERLGGRRVLIVGPGPIGRAIARALRDGLGMQVEAVGRTGRAGDDLFEIVRGADELHAALADADYVIDTMPLTPQTRHMFDAAAFAAMKTTARFVNVGRGATVVESRARRRAGVRAGSPARRSTSSRRSRFPPTVRCGRWRTSSSVRTCRATWRVGRRTSRTCSTTTFAGTCAVRRCATSSTNGSGSRRTTRACRSIRPLIGWAT